MPRYFFSLADGEPHLNEDGEVHADDAAARLAAVHVMHETLRNHTSHVLAGGSYSVTVMSEDDREICRLTLEDRAERFQAAASSPSGITPRFRPIS